MSLGRSRLAALEGAHQATTHAAAEARPWVERLARVGFVSKGVVYAIVGGLALKAAAGTGGKTTDAAGALWTVLQQPFGKVLLGAVAVGLFGYALWRLVQAVLNPGHQEAGAQGMLQRAGYAVSSATYGLLGLTAVRILDGGGASGPSGQDWTARLLAQPWGQWLVGGAGLAIVGVGLYFLYRAYTTEFRKEFKLNEMSPTAARWAILSGRLGYAARGAVFSLMGFFVVQAALQSNAGKVRGLGGVLNSLAQQPAGPWLLGLMALGLLAYSAHMFVAARYRRLWA